MSAVENIRAALADVKRTWALRAQKEFRLACNTAAIAEVLALIDAQQAEIERLKQQLKYQEHRDGRIGTHAEGCYSWGPSHYECALREIERLRAAQMPIPLSNILMAKSKRFPSLRKMAEMLDVDVGYLSRLCSGEKFDPSDEVLMKLGLRRTVSYEEIYKATPLTLRTKSA